MNTSKYWYRNVMTGLFFVTGISSFLSGQFVASTMLFGMAFLTHTRILAKPARA